VKFLSVISSLFLCGNFALAQNYNQQRQQSTDQIWGMKDQQGQGGQRQGSGYNGQQANNYYGQQNGGQYPYAQGNRGQQSQYGRGNQQEKDPAFLDDSEWEQEQKQQQGGNRGQQGRRYAQQDNRGGQQQDGYQGGGRGAQYQDRSNGGNGGEYQQQQNGRNDRYQDNRGQGQQGQQGQQRQGQRRYYSNQDEVKKVQLDPKTGEEVEKEKKGPKKNKKNVAVDDQKKEEEKESEGSDNKKQSTKETSRKIVKGDLKKKDKEKVEEDDSEEEEEEVVDMRNTDEGYYVCQETIDCNNGSTSGCKVYGQNCYTQFNSDDELICRGRDKKGKLTMEKTSCKNQNGNSKNYSSYDRNGPTTFANGDREMNAPRFRQQDRPGWDNVVPDNDGAVPYARPYYAGNVLVYRVVPTVPVYAWPPPVRTWFPPVTCGQPGACGGGYPPRPRPTPYYR